MNNEREAKDTASATIDVDAWEAMTSDERASFERDGYLMVPGVLTQDEVGHYVSVMDELYERHRQEGKLGSGGALHQLSAIHSSPELAPLTDHPRVLGRISSVLGWNLHIYHSHIDVHPPITGEVPFRFEWHQDGGRQNVELETDPRPRLSMKAGYWLSDVSETGRGNFQLVPASHIVNRIDGPPRRDVEWPDPPGAIQVVANPGDVVLFDRRIWHARSLNRSTITRKAVFFGYTFRWVRGRDDVPEPRQEFTPIQRQLLGLLEDVSGDHAWGHFPETVPLYAQLQAASQRPVASHAG
jgi:ectoine hydroxylase-related dioxygenase (phytanoyl-CoA dioxygenase family)